MSANTKSDACSVDVGTEYFEWLDGVRETGAINMFGVRPHLMEEFGLDGKLAQAVVGAWMKTFDGKSSAAKRAAEAFQ